MILRNTEIELRYSSSKLVVDTMSAPAGNHAHLCRGVTPAPVATLGHHQPLAPLPKLAQNHPSVVSVLDDGAGRNRDLE